MTVYSDEEAILTGFFSEVLDDVKKSLEIFEEKKVGELKCGSCGAIDLEKCDAKGYYVRILFHHGKSCRLACNLV
jgi:hypothetical protein